MPRLDQNDRQQALGMLRAGSSVRRVARAFAVHHSTVYRLVQRQQATGTVADRPRTGAPRVTTARQDRGLRRQHLQDRFLTAAASARATQGRNGGTISSRTVRRRLLEGNIRCRRPYRGAVLTQRHRQARRDWAANRGYLGRRPWRDVIFSDESRFCVSHVDGRVRCYRRVGERYQDACVVQRDRYGGPSVMVWAAMNANFRSPLVQINGTLTAKGYVNDVLQPHLVPLLTQHGGVARFVFQHDNATPHTARRTQQFLQQNGVIVMQWPALSPDMNCIEHIWDALGRLVDQQRPRPQTQAQLFAALQQAWNTIPMVTLNRLVMSMPRRLRACLRANGGHTNY
jgi:transposase